MAVRLRKIARELERTPEDLLRLLRELGYDRFKSEDDMLSEPVAEQVRKLARTRPPRASWSRAPQASAPSSPPASPPASPLRADGGSAQAERPSDGDLMAGLVPGVVRVGQRPSPRTARPRLRPEASGPRPTESVMERPVEAIATLPALEEARRALDEVRQRHAADAAALAASRAEVEVLRGALAEIDRDREQLRNEVDRLKLAPAPPPSELPSVLQLLEERGLRGFDEAERAIHALTGGRLFGRLLGVLRVEEPDSVRRLLAERLVLAAGAVPENIGSPGGSGSLGGSAPRAGFPVVTVSPERADLPSLEVVGRALGRIGELLLLNGWRRVLLVGVSPRWHALIRDGLDRRIELLFRAQASEEATRQDVVVGWNVEIEGEGLRPARISVKATSFGDFLDRWVSVLAAEDGG